MTEIKEPRGQRGKRPETPLNEHVYAIRTLSSLGKKELELLILGPKTTGALIGREPKTMDRDRTEQRKAIADAKATKFKPNIDPKHPRSLPYVPPAPGEREVGYMASDVLAYLQRKFASVDRSFLSRSAVDPRMRGFQSWLSFGDAAQTWPFAIQEDGRPLDMHEAIATGRLGVDSARMNIREFCDLMAHSASRSSANGESHEIGTGVFKPEKQSEKSGRWGKPGGPI